MTFLVEFRILHQELAAEFINNMDACEINSINAELDVLQNMNSCNQCEIDDIVDKINTIFLNSAKQTFGVAKNHKCRRKCTH